MLQALIRGRFIVFIALASICRLSVALPGGLGSNDEPEVRPDPVPATDRVHLYYWGTVSEVDNRHITIRFDAKDIRQFSVSETLAAGKVPMKPRPGPNYPRGYRIRGDDMYRLSDVKVGDWVGIFYSLVDGEMICDHIRITKRPGGRIPPLPEEAEKLLNPIEIMKERRRQLGRSLDGVMDGWENYQYIPYHERMNAHWDLEDFGIPYPEKFGPDRRRFVVAPKPREGVQQPAKKAADRLPPDQIPLAKP